MPVALSPTSFKPYVFKEDRSLPEEDQTKFHMKLMNFEELCAFEDAMADMDSGKTRDTMKACMDALKIGLLGWTNFKYADGKQVDFTEMFSTNFPCFGPDVTQRLISAALEVNKLSEEESKNSNSSPELLKETSSKVMEANALKE